MNPSVFDGSLLPECVPLHSVCLHVLQIIQHQPSKDAQLLNFKQKADFSIEQARFFNESQIG